MIIINQIFLFTLHVFSLFYAPNNTVKSNSNDTSEVRYIGIAFHVDVFVTMKNDTVIAEWFYNEVPPAIVYSDTLQLNYQDSASWSGTKSKIIRTKKQCYFQATDPYTMKVKLKKTESTQWNSEYNRNKNTVLLITEYQSFINNTIYQIEYIDKIRLWREMEIKYQLIPKLSQLNPIEFQAEFQKFKKELYDSLINQSKKK